MQFACYTCWQRRALDLVLLFINYIPSIKQFTSVKLGKLIKRESVLSSEFCPREWPCTSGYLWCVWLYQKPHQRLRPVQQSLHQWPGLPGGSDGEESACSADTWVRFLDQEDPLEKGMASILACKIPWTAGAWRSKVHEVAVCWTRLSD